ncbi:zinc finger ZZ-type and EF-hand domain-containing protein 1-like isoform X3 [Apostichopus japonicus]|uniref:zinc finger ZZ-type and EF-hand domain-containing protein 1-like isoform X3 n=1 Tax=Stichopus japonicus TaxID=307972 RepID=UPI003AB8700F
MSLLSSQVMRRTLLARFDHFLTSLQQERREEDVVATGGEEENSSHFIVPDKGQDDELDLSEFHLIDLFNSETLREAVSKVSDVVPETVVQQHHGHLLRWLEERNMRNEQTVTVGQFCDVLFNRGVNRKEAEEAFEQFDVDGEGVAYINSMMEALKSTNGANLRGELSHAIRTLRACSLAPGVIDIFAAKSPELGNHGYRILKYLLRNRAPSSTLPYPSLDGFTNISAMRMVVLEQYLKSAQSRKDSSKDDSLNELKYLNKPYCSIFVSSNRQDVGRLADGDVSTFWQSDGPAHSHWIRLKMKSGVSLNSLSILVTRSDQSYMPQHIVVAAGNSPGSMEMVKDIHIPSSYPSDEVTLLDNAKIRSRFIQINIKKCQYEGCDVRVHGLKAVGSRVVTGMEVNIVETSAVWYLSILSATATAAIPMAPHLQSAILENTKTALQQMPSLSLCKLYCKKSSFITPKILDQAEEFLVTVSKNSDGKTSLEGLLLLLQLSLARGNIPSVLKCLQEMHNHFDDVSSGPSDGISSDSPIPGGLKIKKSIESVQTSLLKKHASVLENFEVTSSGGSRDLKSEPSNVLSSNWNSEAYVSTEPSVTMVFHNPNHSFQLTKVDIKVSKGGIGPKCGLILVADEVTALENYDMCFDFNDLERFDSWTEDDYRRFNEEGFKGHQDTIPCDGSLEVVAHFSLLDNFDEIEVPIDSCPVGSHVIIKFLKPRLESATRLGIVGLRFHGYWKEKSLLDRVEILQPEEHSVCYPTLLSSVLWFLVTLCQNVEKINKKEAAVNGKFQSVDFNLENLHPESLCEFYFQLPDNSLSTYLQSRELLLHLFHSSIPQFTKEIEQREINIKHGVDKVITEGPDGSIEETKETEINNATLLKQMFDHLCQLLEPDLPSKMLGSRVNMAASRVILDGAPIFFPDKESRKKQLFNMIYDPSEDLSSRIVFRSLCWYFGSVDSSGLLDLPSDVSEVTVDTSAILSVFDTLLCVAYKEFEEIIEDNDPLPPKECSHVVNLLNALQVNLLTWCQKLIQTQTPKAEAIAVNVLKSYCKSMYSWICNAVILWSQQGTNIGCMKSLKFSFLESTFHQMITILHWMSDSKIPHLQLAHRLFKVAEELHKVVNLESVKIEMELSSELKDSDELVTLRTWNVESSHNYENNQNITQMFYCPGAQEFHITFDSRCETERRYDYLEFTLTRGTKVRYDQKVGSDKWPETVTFKSIDRLQFLFHSDSTTNAWGYKFTVTAKGQADVSICWTQDMQLSLSSLLGKFCSHAMHQTLEEDVEEGQENQETGLVVGGGGEIMKQIEEWSSLFRGGLRNAQEETQTFELTARDQKKNHGDEALLGLLKQLSGEKEETEQAKLLWQRCDEMSSEARQLGAGVGGEEIEKAVKAVFAATIWHTSSLSAHVQQYAHKGGEVAINDELVAAFESAERARVYLVNLHQMQIKLQEAMENQSGENPRPPEVVGKITQHWCVQACLKKARFLLELNPCWQETKAGVDSSSSDEGEKELAASRRKDVLEMIKSPLLSAESIRKVLQFRESHAKVRTEVFELASRFLDISKDIFQDSFIIFLKQFLTLRDPPTSHFMQGLCGCGISLEEKYRKSYYEFVMKLVNALTSFRERTTITDKANAALSCVKGFILHLLSNQWESEDFDFLKKISLPQLLIDLAKTPDAVGITSVEQNDISPEKQLQVYQQCQEWLKHCLEEPNFKTWYDNINQTATFEERRAMHLFVARFYELLNVNIQCDGCHAAIIGTRYRCLVCEDIDFCCSCFPGGLKVDQHTDEHPLVHLKFKCDGCHALIVGTRMHCDVCSDFDLCYGCHHTKSYPDRHKDHHVVTPIPMTVANQSKSQPQAYNQLHSWLLFSSLTLSMSKAACHESKNASEPSAASMLQTCVDLILSNLQTISQLDNSSSGASTSQEKVFTEKTLEKLLGLFAALIPQDTAHEVCLTKMLKLEKLLPLLFRFARETTGQYVPTQHLAVGLIGKLLGWESPKFADECLSQSEEKNERDDDEARDGDAGDGEAREGTLETKEDVDGTKTVLFICSFGASCLEKCHLEWAALLPHLLMQLSTRPAWQAPVAEVLNSSFSRLPDHCQLPTIFTLFTVAGFPEVFGHGSQAVYHDGNHDDNDVMVLKHFLQNGQVYIVDGKTRKAKHVTEDHLDLKGIDSQPLNSDQLVTFLSISSQVMAKLEEGTETLSVETLWALYLVLKTLYANFKPHFFEHIQDNFLPLLSHLANSQTGLSRHWLLKDLEVLSIQLYTSNRNDSIVQPLFDVTADFQVRSHQSSKPPKTLEDIINDAKASISGCSSSASETSSSGSSSVCEDSDDLLVPPGLSERPTSTFSEESDASEYHSFISDQNEMSKMMTNINKSSSVTKVTSAANKDPLAGLGEEAKTAIQSCHEAFNASLPVLRALYEVSGCNVDNFIQKASNCFDGNALNVGDDVLILSKCWEPPAQPREEQGEDSESGTENVKPALTRRIALPEPTQLMTSLISHSKQEMKERFKKHQREKSKDLLIKELEKHGKVGTRDFLYKINHVLSIMYARNLLVSLLADWPEAGHMTISKNLGCQETNQLMNVLDLLQRTADEDVYRKIIGVVVKHCSSDVLNQLCQSACSFMQEMALQPRTVESKHNYDNDTKIEGTVTLSGARYLLIKFDERCCTEDCCDILTIASDNKYKHNVRTFSGSSGNWINFDIPGDTLYYKFVSDFNNNDWGFKFTVIGNHVGRFETGFVLLDSVLQCSGLVSSISLPTLWASLIEVCNKQVGHPRLKSIRLLLRILQYISSEGNTSCHSDVETKDDASLGVDLTLLKPLWFLLNQMNNNLSEDSTTCQSIHAAHSALTELFFFVENLVKSKNLVESYILALVDEEEIKASVRQGLCNVAAIGSAIGVPNKASLLLEKEEKTATPRT